MRIDLLYHMMAGFIIATISTLLFPIWVGIILAAIIGFFKEIYDWKIKKTIFDWKDMVCTIVGGFAGMWVDLVKLHKFVN